MTFYRKMIRSEFVHHNRQGRPGTRGLNMALNTGVRFTSIHNTPYANVVAVVSRLLHQSWFLSKDRNPKNVLDGSFRGLQLGVCV